MRYYRYALPSGETRGPVSLSTLNQLRDLGMIGPDTLVKEKGSKQEWVPLYRSDVPSSRNRFDSVSIFDDLPSLPLESQAYHSLLQLAKEEEAWLSKLTAPRSPKRASPPPSSPKKKKKKSVSDRPKRGRFSLRRVKKKKH